MTIDELLILVIEPSRFQRHIIVETLRELGIRDIEQCHNGTLALEQMKSLKPDIVMSAMHLPDMFGTDIIKQMRLDPELNDVTFMLVSSESHYRYLEPIRQAGAIAILPKPFKPSDMQKALQSTMHYISDAMNHKDEDFFETTSVLVVDDSGLSRRFVRQILERIGIGTIVEAKDGADALEKMKSNTFDLIISDYNMPNIDGIELVEHIRDGDLQPTVPVMMITSEQNENRLAAIENAGVSALCSKPLSYDMLKQLIEQLVADHEL